MGSRLSNLGRTAAVLAALSACGEPPVMVSVQQARATRLGPNGLVALDLLATDGETPISCDDGTFEVTVSVTAEGPDGHFTELPPQSWMLACDDGRTGDLALVVDNSGSEAGFLPWLQDAARTMAHELLDRGGRLSLVRVSTNAEVTQPMTADRPSVDRAIDDLYVANGFTALWDGVRTGHETLGDGPVLGDRTDVAEFCFGEKPLGVVAFTDGVDNNSSDENQLRYDATKYPGDGVPTALEDLLELRLGDTTTPIYTLGLGADVDHDALEHLATHSGARYRHIDSAEDIPDAFSVLQKTLDATAEVCVELPGQECGDLLVRVAWTYTPADGSPPVTGVVDEPVSYTCREEEPTDGRVATILMTLGDPGLPEDFAAQLAVQAVEWVSPRLRPHVLIVLDDGNNGEDVTDHELVQWLLSDVDTLTVEFLDEASAGLTPADVEGFDVVWFANPGYPMDDQASFDTLSAFVADGGGLVLQGDDMTWSSGKKFSMTALTGLTHVDNGTSACGVNIDNRRNGTYTVSVLGDVDHALSRDLPLAPFTYGNDIDGSTPIDDERVTVLATAVPTARATTCAPRPVIVGYAP